jgi:aspartate/methionine/tyrosine aminotransferase
MNKFDLTWGESVAVRQAFLKNITLPNIHFTHESLLAMDYTPFNGDDKLIASTKAVILRQTGETYKHVFLTNGASGGCTIALRAYASLGARYGMTNPAPYFPLYPGMMKAAGLHHTADPKITNAWDQRVFLLDTPGNPTGQHMDVPTFYSKLDDVIWDAVYHNNVYCALKVPSPKHNIAVGSYSKLTGLNGIRLGWIATNDDVLAEEIATLIAPEYCGLSKPSKMIMAQLLEDINLSDSWGKFENDARDALDYNRGMWSMLEKYFEGTPVPVNGMFYYAKMDKACKELFEKAEILWQSGTKCGHSDDFGRFNIGQDPVVIREAVKAVLKADKC